MTKFPEDKIRTIINNNLEYHFLSHELEIFCAEEEILFTKKSPKSRKVLFPEKSIQQFKLIFQNKNISVQTLPTAYKNLKRHEVTQFAANEKLGKNPTEDLIEIKPYQNHILQNGQPFLCPNDWIIKRNYEDILQEPYTSVLYIENFEFFNYYYKAQWLKNFDFGQKPLILYRGHDSKAPKKFLEKNTKPVFAATDVDPSGINIALTTKNLQEFCAPSIEFLLQLKKNQRAQKKLFLNQIASLKEWNNTHAIKTPSVKKYWDFILENETAFTQEHFLC